MSLLSSGFSIDEIIKRFTKDSDDAKAASLAQLKQLMSTIQQLSTQTGRTFEEALGALSQQGETGILEAGERGQQTLAAGRQELISSGLSSTTLGPNLRRAVDKDVGREQRGIREGVAAGRAGLLTQRAGIETQIGGLLASSIQGVNNIGPDLGQFAALIQAASAAGNANQQRSVSIGPGSAGGPPSPRRSSAAPGSSSPGGSAPGGGGGGGATDGGGGVQIITRESSGLGSRDPRDFGTSPVSTTSRSSGGVGSPQPGIGRMLFERGREFSFA